MDWIAITCWVVLGVAGLLAIWALFWDRPRGRLRCRRCAYDMSGGGLMCPECGREHKTERSLRKTRRKWKTAVVSMTVVVLVMHYRSQRVLIAYEGAIGLVPSVLLAAFIDMDGYSSYSPNESNFYHNRMNAYEAMDHRIDRVAMSRFSRRLFAHRLARHASRVSDDGDEVRVYDISGLFPIRYIPVRIAWSSTLGTSGMPEERPTLDFRDSFEIAEGLLFVTDQQWESKQRDVVGVVGDQLVIKAAPNSHELIQSVIRNSERHIWRIGDGPSSLTDTNSMAGFVYIMPWMNEDLAQSNEWWGDRVVDEMLDVMPERWDSGGDRRSIVLGSNSGRIVVWAAEDHHREIQRHLNTLDLDKVSN